MLSNIEKYKKDIKNLIKNGEIILKEMKDDESLNQLRQKYELWYSESYAVIKIVLPDRISDFSKMYYDDKKKAGLITHFQYVLSKAFYPDFDYLLSTRIVPPKEIDISKSVFDSQLGILKACSKRFESSLFDIKQLLKADIFDSELDVSSELNKKGFSRGAGAVAGVVLEGYLLQIVSNHNILTKKKNPTINDLNQLLKDNDIIEIHTWRYIQHLADLRNLCDHKKSNEPKKEEIEELINGITKISKSLF
jgi:hypothetical protein